MSIPRVGLIENKDVGVGVESNFAVITTFCWLPPGTDDPNCEGGLIFQGADMFACSMRSLSKKGPLSSSSAGQDQIVRTPG